MNYVTLKNGDKISVMGLGTAKLGTANKTEGTQIVKTAMKHGVDLIDMKANHAMAFVFVGEATDGRRDQVTLVLHFGPDYSKGDERRVTALEQVMNSVTAQMQTLRIDILQYACLDCPAGMADLDAAAKNGVMPLLQELKGARVIHNLCAYTEDAESVAPLLATGKFAFVLAKAGDDVLLYEEAGNPLATIKSPADLAQLHVMLKEYKEN